jgi:CubicO group peptidase (beta-lactamase class C family)
MPAMNRLQRHALASTVLGVALALVSHLSAQSDAATMMTRVEGAQTGQRELDALTLAGVMQRFKVPGMSVAVIKDSAIHWAKGYGLADVESKRVVETNTLFQAASISKPVTAMAAVRLAQEGRLSLDAASIPSSSPGTCRPRI